jgi:chromosome segregation ATPase
MLSNDISVLKKSHQEL